MASKLFKTRGIVLRTVKYGETSLVVTIYTEVFGIQSYLVNGVRKNTSRGSGKANLFQPAALLDLVVYHQDGKSLHRLKEFAWAHLYQHIFSDVSKNAVALFMVELVAHCLRQPEENAALFQFTEDCLLQLDEATEAVSANFALFYSLHLTHFFGVSPRMELTDAAACYFDLVESIITDKLPTHEQYIEGRKAAVCADILKARQPVELEEIKLNHTLRRQLLQAIEQYYLLHVQDFRPLKSLSVLAAVLG
jgi:DNA repair protein RecO (recombination protein O)